MTSCKVHDFFIVDVFAESKYAGNQLAVILNAGDLSTDQMQSIAQEMHFSESAFVLSNTKQNGGFDVRIFTPGTEVPFAGHPTLGTALIIQRHLIGRPVDSLVLNLPVGPISVTFKGEELWMRQIAPTFGKILPAPQAAEMLGVLLAELDRAFPVQWVSTGLPFWIVPLKSLDAVRKAQPRWELFTRITGETAGRQLLVFAPETYHPTNQLNVRVFVDEVGVTEDPATGSANGCLAGYLVKHRYLGGRQIALRVEQGYEIGRPSLVLLFAQEGPESIEVQVGGRVFVVARGELI